MTNVTNIHNPDVRCNQSIERSLLEFLKPKSEGRYSRLEAYCDLLGRAASDTYTVKVSGIQLQLQPGQFVSSISELGRKWQWQRATVRQFIDGLKAIQQLEFKPVSKMFIFTINSAQYLSIRIKHVEDIRLFSEMQFGRFLYGTASVEETAECLDFYFSYLWSKIDDKIPDDEKLAELINHQYDTFKGYLSSLFLLDDSMVKLPDDMELSIRNLIERNQMRTWYKLIAMVGKIKDSKELLCGSIQSDNDLPREDALLASRLYDFYISLVKLNPNPSVKSGYMPDGTNHEHKMNRSSTYNPNAV